MSWTTPITWAIRDAITMAKLNSQLRDNLSYLFARPSSKVTILGTGTNLTTTSTTMVAVDDAQFTLTLTIATGEDVELWINGVTGGSATNINAIMDVIIDDTNFVSSGNTSDLAFGLWYTGHPASPLLTGLRGRILVSGLAAGTHTFKLRWKVSSAGTITLYLNGKYFQFGAQTH